MNKINLNSLELKTFTEQDAVDYCQINNINFEEIIELSLKDNKLTDISGIKLFKNLKSLYLSNNKLTDISVLKTLKQLIVLNLSKNEIKNISVIQYLNNLEILTLGWLKLKSNQIKYINSCKKLKEIHTIKAFENRSVLNQLNKNIKIY